MISTMHNELFPIKFKTQNLIEGFFSDYVSNNSHLSAMQYSSYQQK